MSLLSLKPRKAPTQARAKVTHGAILQAATQLLATVGLEGFNTNAIAERAGTSIGTLYQYFPNKQALLLELIHQQKKHMFINIAHAMRSVRGEPLEAAVQQLVRGRIKHLRENSRVALLLSQQEASLPIHDLRVGYLASGSHLFRAGLAHWGAAAQHLDATRVAKTVPAMIHGILAGWLSDTPGDLDGAEQETVQAVLGYLQRQGGARVY